MIVNGRHYRTVWFENGTVKMINQPLLPHRFEVFGSRTYRETADSISGMVVRGAGAIGAAAGYGMAQGIMAASDENFQGDIEEAAECLKGARPTAQNPLYAVDRVLLLLHPVKGVTGRAVLNRDAQSL